MQGILNDLRYGFRVLRESPGVTLVAVLSLALGIGANVTNFSLANALLFRPLPVEDPDRLVILTTSYEDNLYNPTSYPDFQDIREHNDVFSDVAAYFFFPMGLEGRDRPEVVTGQLVTWNFFDVLGVRPAAGRTFLPEEEAAPNGPLVAILSYRFWENRFGSDPGILGAKLLLNSQPFEVVGIAPKGFYGMNTVVVPDVWVPVTTVAQTLPFPIPLEGRYSSWLAVVGRLKSGLHLEQAQAATNALSENMADQLSPDSQNRKSFTLVEANRSRAGLHEPNDGLRRLSIMLMCLVALVLLIACFNVINLHLARASERQTEIGVRLALGASRGRILRQLLTESLMLSFLAGAAGILFAVWAIELLVRSIPEVPGFLLEIDADLDGRVLVFTLLLTLASGIVSGLAPAFHLIRPIRLAALQGQSRSLTRSRVRSSLQSGLVVAQMAVSVVLLVSAGLFMHSLRNALDSHPGFDLKEGLIAEIDLGFGNYGETEGRAFYDRLVERVEALPGVEAATLAVDLPLSQMHITNHVSVDGYEPAPGERMVMRWNLVGPGYFETMGVPIIRGRGVNERDRTDSRRVAVVNETMARRYWGGRDPVGSSVRQSGEAWEVIGVAQDGKYDELGEQPQPYVCFPLRQSEYVKRVNLAVRTAGRAEPAIEMVRTEVQRLDANLPPARIYTIEEFITGVAKNAGGQGDLVSVFGLLALVLSMIGVYGLMSYTVSRRRREFGIRMALGARREEVLGSVLKRGLRITITGLVIGLSAAAGVARLLEGFLFEVSPLDWMTYVAVSLVLLAVATTACYLPARLAAKVNPAVALRDE